MSIGSRESEILYCVSSIYDELARSSPDHVFALSAKHQLAELLGNKEVMHAVEDEIARLHANEDGLLEDKDKPFF